jgi:creatine kinase
LFIYILIGFVARFLRDAGGYDDWPTGRAIFHNPDKTFLVWVNEEDHLRFISMQKGGNLAQVYKRLVTVSNDISS